jgi:hypothetical protein
MGTNLFFYLLTPVLLALSLSPENLISLGVIWLARTLLLFAAYIPLARRLGQALSPAALPLLDFLYLVFYCAWGLSLLVRRPLQWK